MCTYDYDISIMDKIDLSDKFLVNNQKMIKLCNGI
jgi:hypothetical protein